MSNKRMDPLAGLSDLEDESSSDEEQQQEEEAPPAKKAKKQEIDLETLRRHGLQEGPSVLFVPETKADEGGSWAWGSGADRRAAAAEEETEEERAANRAAVTSGAEEAASYALKAQAQAQALHAAKKAEREKLRSDKKLTWNQKEKKKRDEGKASRGKNYVEEEKRRLREAGVYSGFD